MPFLTPLTMILLILSSNSLLAATTLKINGSSTVNPIVVDASEKFNQDGWKILVDTQGGSSGGIAHVAESMADIGMSSREVSNKDRQKFPNREFQSHVIGYDGVALVISTSLYDAGVKSLTREQIKKIYEGKVTNWQQVGGPDRRVVFFNKEPGRGTWEVFAKFVYGNADQAPKVFHPEVGANQEARTKVANHPGAITQLSASWAWDQKKVRAVAIVDQDKPIAASFENIKNGSYPMKRPLLLVTIGAPKGPTKEFIRFVQSKDGQAYVKKHGYLGVSTAKN